MDNHLKLKIWKACSIVVIFLLSFLIWSVFEKVTIRKKHDINTCTSGLIAALTCAGLFMLIYFPIYFYFLNSEHNMLLMLIIYFICIVTSVLLNYQLLKRKYNSELEKKIILAWLLVVIVNAILTYYHPNLALF